MSPVQVAQPFAFCLASSLMTWDMQIKPNLLVKKRLANTGGRRRAHQVKLKVGGRPKKVEDHWYSQARIQGPPPPQKIAPPNSQSVTKRALAPRGLRGPCPPLQNPGSAYGY